MTTLEGNKEDMTEEEYITMAYEQLAGHEKEIQEYNESLIKSFSQRGLKSFYDLVDGSKVTGKIEYVNKPRGEKQNESYGVFKNIHVDQRSYGDSGDSFAGCIYANVKGQWISIPYEC